jgi:DNA methylase
VSLKREKTARRGRLRSGPTKPRGIVFNERDTRHLNFDIVRNSGSMQRLIPEVLSGRAGAWQAQKKAWLKLGIQSELGRKRDLLYRQGNSKSEAHSKIVGAGPQTSVFDPVLSQVVYEKLTQPGDLILDPFAGGSVRGIVAAVLGRNYTGIDVRPDQITANNTTGQLLARQSQFVMVFQAPPDTSSEREQIWLFSETEIPRS